MPPFILKFAQFASQRPKDKTIRRIHVLLGMIIILLLWVSQSLSIVDIPFMGTVSPAHEKIIEYSFWILGFILILRGIITNCIMKNRATRILQGIIGFLLIIIGGPIMDPVVTTETVTIPDTSNTIQVPVTPILHKSLHAGALIVLIGIFWMLVGITGKGTTSKCVQYGEIVKKIRV